MHLICITEASYNTSQEVDTQGAITDGSTSVSITISSSLSSYSHTIAHDLLQYTAPDFLAQLSWLFERYVEYDSDQTERARRIQHRLIEQRQQLLALLYNALEGIREDVLVVIKDMVGHDNQHMNLRWELLESLEDRTYPPLSVVRANASFEPYSESQLSKASVSFHAPERSSTILALSARPKAKDIPHRLITRTMLRTINGFEPLEWYGVHDIQSKGPRKDGSRVNDFYGGNPSLEVVRPGYLTALEQHLGGHNELGRYPLVHLDLHGGINETGEAFLVFTRIDSRGRVRSHKVSTKELAAVLINFGVRYVVLNACRSAIGTTPSSNLALGLVQAGIYAAIGMSFNLYSSTAEAFVSAFYQDYLSGAPFHLAASRARGAMRQRSRITTISDSLANDSIVPMLFCSAAYVHESQLLPRPSRVFQPYLDTQEFWWTQHDPAGGRERDLLHLETYIVDHRKVLIQGELGIGKTTFLRHTSEWWRATGLIKKLIFIEQDAAALKPLSMMKLFVAIATQLDSQEESRSHRADIFKYLNDPDNRCLIVIDGFGSITWPEENHGMLRAQFVFFLKSLTHCIVLLSSRSDLRWLKSHIPVRLNLTGLDAQTSLTHALSHVRLSRAPRIPRDDVNAKGFASVVELGRGNPFAIDMLASDYSTSPLNAQAYFESLIKGDPLDIRDGWLFHNNSSKSCKEAYELLQRLITAAELVEVQDPLSALVLNPLNLMPFWHAIPKNLEAYWKYFSQELERTGIDRMQTAFKAELGIGLEGHTESSYSGQDNIGRSFVMPISTIASSVQRELVRLGLLDEWPAETLMSENMHCRQEYVGINPIMTMLLRYMAPKSHRSWISRYAPLSKVAHVRLMDTRVRSVETVTQTSASISWQAKHLALSGQASSDFTNLVTAVSFASPIGESWSRASSARLASLLIELALANHDSSSSHATIAAANQALGPLMKHAVNTQHTFAMYLKACNVFKIVMPVTKPRVSVADVIYREGIRCEIMAGILMERLALLYFRLKDTKGPLLVSSFKEMTANAAIHRKEYDSDPHCIATRIAWAQFQKGAELLFNPDAGSRRGSLSTSMLETEGNQDHDAAAFVSRIIQHKADEAAAWSSKPRA